MMAFTLDIVGAILCGITAVLAFWLHSVTSRTYGQWYTPPPEVRLALFIFGACMMLRSANLAVVDPSAPTGRLNEWGIIASLSMTFLFGTVVRWVTSKTHAKEFWSRLGWFEAQAGQRPDLVPVPMTTAEAAQVHEMLGVSAVGPGASPQKIIELEGRKRLVH